MSFYVSLLVVPDFTSTSCFSIPTDGPSLLFMNIIKVKKKKNNNLNMIKSTFDLVNYLTGET